MGTLEHQPPRNPRTIDLQQLDNLLSDASEVASNHSVSIEVVISAKHALELERQNDLKVADGDAKDEQLSGFGSLLTDISLSLGS